MVDNDDVFLAIKQDFLENADSIIRRDVKRLRQRGEISFDAKEFKISSKDFIEHISQFCTVERKTIDFDAFDKWYAENDYATLFPDYVSTYSDLNLLQKKAYEHWLSLTETADAPSKRMIDVACATSPFSKLVEEHFKDECDICYRADLPLPEYGFLPGVNGNVIGSSANAIPLEARSVDRIYSHNAIEHFEGEVYEGFFKESARLLKKGGHLYICPLFVAGESFAYVSLTGIYRRLSFPSIPMNTKIVYSDKIGQPYSLQISPGFLKEKIIAPLKKEIDFTLVHYVNDAERPYGVTYALHGVRK